MQRKAKILFVDDEERIVNLLKMMFRSQYEVFTATSGLDALKIIKEQHIDVIVSDQRMPEILGIDLLSQVRNESPNTIRILLTGYSDLVAIIGAVNAGEVSRFVNKPWNQEEIKTVIAECVEIAIANDTISSEAVNYKTKNATCIENADAVTSPKNLLKNIAMIYKVAYHSQGRMNNILLVVVFVVGFLSGLLGGMLPVWLHSEKVTDTRILGQAVTNVWYQLDENTKTKIIAARKNINAE